MHVHKCSLGTCVLPANDHCFGDLLASRLHSLVFLGSLSPLSGPLTSCLVLHSPVFLCTILPPKARCRFRQDAWELPLTHRQCKLNVLQPALPFLSLLSLPLRYYVIMRSSCFSSQTPHNLAFLSFFLSQPPLSLLFLCYSASVYLLLH